MAFTFALALAFGFGLGLGFGLCLGFGFGGRLPGCGRGSGGRRGRHGVNRKDSTGRIADHRDAAASRYVHRRHPFLGAAGLGQREPLVSIGHMGIRQPVGRPGHARGLDVDAAALHALLSEDQIDAGGAHVHAFHGVPAEQAAVESKCRFVVGGGELVPGKGTERGRAVGFRARIFRIDDGEYRALRILQHGVAPGALHVRRRLHDRAAGAYRRFGRTVDIASAKVLQPVWRNLGRNIRGQLHDAGHRPDVRMADRVCRIERPRHRFPVGEFRIELLCARHIARHQLVPDKSTTHIFHGRISAEWDEWIGADDSWRFRKSFTELSSEERFPATVTCADRCR